tara:strand:+ start:17550 stop:18668 length:1119 start_codon:yes stop_codon:yes gene_type:complete
LKNNSRFKNVILLTTFPHRYGKIEDVKKVEIFGNIHIQRIKIPQHNNSFIRQTMSFSFFFFKSLMFALKNRNKYDVVFATSSRFGTSMLGFVISKIFSKKFAVDIRDIFSDSLKSLNFSNSFFGKILIKMISYFESKIVSHSTWINFVSPGFLKYKHINFKNSHINIFTNGIDQIFIENRKNNKKKWKSKIIKPLKITYAGNIGYGQGLEKTIPKIAQQLNDKIFFQLIGDGSSVQLIKKEIARLKINNVQIIPPVTRNKLLAYYNKSDVLFLQLNDFDVFKSVIPSKIFDYGSFDKPVLAGVKGVAKQFLEENLSHVFTYDLDDQESALRCIEAIMKFDINLVNNDQFVKKYNRNKIMRDLVKDLHIKFCK